MRTSILAKKIDIEFPIYETPNRSLKKTIFNRTTGGKIAHDASKHSVVSALNDITFNLEEGARLGLVGPNGSGKTTLLRVLSGVYTPIRGEVKVRGKVASLLDISMGLDPDATGYENIYLRGILDGLKPAAIRNKMEEIADFSELGDYLNLPVRTYSSGMMLRLAFSISTNVEAEILIMDEWLSVGDAAFSNKAAERLETLVNKAAILVVASHDPKLIARVCNRKICLERGRVVGDEVILMNGADPIALSAGI